jgi:PEGA domain
MPPENVFKAIEQQYFCNTIYQILKGSIMPSFSINRAICIMYYVLGILSTNIFPQYTIPSFQTGAHTIPPTGNDIIVPFEGTSLKQVSIVPALKPGEVLLRRRFSATEYGLFIGKMNEKVYNKLSAFRPSKSFDLAENVGRKYYSQEVNNPDLDIANLYFDNDLLYVENAARLFYNDGSWSNISAETRLPSRLTVTSTPSGAHVLIDGREKGVTPYNAGAIFSPSVVVQVKMDGYYIQENYVDIPSGQSVKKHWDLSKKITFNDGTSISEEAYTAENTESAEELGERMDTLIIHIKDQKASNVKDLEVFNSTYPKLPGRGEFEEKTDYENRADKYNSEKTAQKQQLVDKGDQVVSRLESALDRVKEYKQRIEARVYTKYFSSSVLKIGKYDADKHVFPAEVAVNEELFKFGPKSVNKIMAKRSIFG